MEDKAVIDTDEENSHPPYRLIAVPRKPHRCLRKLLQGSWLFYGLFGG